MAAYRIATKAIACLRDRADQVHDEPVGSRSEVVEGKASRRKDERSEQDRILPIRATKEIPLRPNAVDPVTGENSGDNTGVLVPVICFEDRDAPGTRITLILKGGGSENVGLTYKLPDPSLGARRDLEGVRRCVVDAVARAQGRGCPPYIVAVAPLLAVIGYVVFRYMASRSGAPL